MKSNTKLTDVEIRWIKNTYERDKYGVCKITKRINEGRAKAGMSLISERTVGRAIKKIVEGTAIIPSNAGVSVICPECGHTFNIKC